MFVLRDGGNYFGFMKQKDPSVKHWKSVRKDVPVTVRFTKPLYQAIVARAYDENKSISAVIVESVRKHLDFKMPPMRGYIKKKFDTSIKREKDRL